jgi:hypothetical protein
MVMVAASLPRLRGVCQPCPRLSALLGLLLGSSVALGGVDPAAVDPFIFRIISHRNDGQQPLMGTGFAIQGAPVLVSNYHVIDGAKDIVVLQARGKDEPRPAQVLKASKVHDIAILAVPGLSGSGLWLSPRAEIGKGTPVWALGYPGAADRGRVDLNSSEATLTQGIVNRTLYQAWEENGPVLAIVQHDAKSSHGNSGGPLLDACGQVVGVNSQIELAERALETYNYALAVGELRSLLQDWGIPYRNAERPCMPGPAGSHEQLLWWSSAIAVAMAASALAVALRVARRGLALRYPGSTGQRAALGRRRQGDIPGWRDSAAVSAMLTLRRDDQVVCALRCPAGESRQWTLGRSAAQCDQVIDDDAVSRCHVRLLWRPQRGQWYVEDLNSSNGTWLNGRALQAYEPVPLPQDARLTLGELQLEVTRESANPS